MVSDQILSSLQTETDLLKFFVQKEKECIEYVNNTFGGYEDLKKFMTNELESIFKSNLIIKEKTELIYFKLKDIPIEELRTEKEYYNKLKVYFGNTELPQFLIEKDIKNLQCILFYSNRKKGTTALINQMQNRDFNQNNGQLIQIYENIRNNKVNAFNNINHRYELFDLFITINYKVFNKFYCGDSFFHFLETNIAIIKKYFGQNITFNEIYDNFRNMNEELANNKKEYLFHIIDNEINGNLNKIFNIIASFYCTLFYEFKDLKLYKDVSNIGNLYINLILKNFVFYLDKKYKTKLNLNKNLFELLLEIYLLDISYLTSANIYPSMNKTYTFKDIDSILKNDNIVSDYYNNLKETFCKNQNNMDGMFTLLKKNLGNLFGGEGDLTVYEKNIHLIPVDDNIYSNTITILIDGFTTQDKDQVEQWRDLIYFFQKETMFYFFKWPSDSQENILKPGIMKALKNASKHFAAAKNRAKICGKMLAYILLSNKFFNDFQINLIGFSLGNHVIKHCIKELYKINNLNNFCKLKNVILIAAATHIKNKNLWKKYIEELVIDRFINCFSKVDKVLSMAYCSCMLKTAQGNNSLEVYNDKGVNLVQNYDFTKNNFGHLSYNYGVVAQKIFENYKDI
jgi:hypothetical protein